MSKNILKTTCLDINFDTMKQLKFKNFNIQFNTCFFMCTNNKKYVIKNFSKKIEQEYFQN